MGLVLGVSALVLLSFPMRAGQRTPDGTSIANTEQAGKRLFFQRCSFCHVGMPTKYQTYAPVLYGELVAELGDDTVREKITDGSVAMPAFKYSLKPGDIDSIVAYLKTVKKQDAVHPSAKQ
jgi:mono/diheme cytochrome c family protein